MNQKVRLVIPEAQSPQAIVATEKRAVAKGGIRLGVLYNSKGNADHLLQMIIDGVKKEFKVESVVMTRKPFSSKPATDVILDKLTREADLVVSAMAD